VGVFLPDFESAKVLQVNFFIGRCFMGIHRDIYEFAARAGALEGYVYAKEKIEEGSLTNWVKSVVEQYRALPSEVREEFQDLCDGTLGRTVQSLIPLFGEDHEMIIQLKTLVQGESPSSPNDFSREH
jgi:hypothetical protein